MPVADEVEAACYACNVHGRIGQAAVLKHICWLLNK